MWLPDLPERLTWDHNAHYHRWLLRRLPPHPERALDVGCGSGRLAHLLAARAQHVDALDRSPAMLDQARARGPQAPNLTWIEGDFLSPAVPLVRGGYDAITAVSSLHHLPLRPALRRLTELLRPGGVLTVVGHYQPTPADQALDVLRIPANAAVGTALALVGRSGRPDDENMPVLPPSATLAEVRSAVSELLPGATSRRGLFWRFLLVWSRP